jgi:hypothetical protein
VIQPDGHASGCLDPRGHDPAATVCPLTIDRDFYPVTTERRLPTGVIVSTYGLVREPHWRDNEQGEGS